MAFPSVTFHLLPRCLELTIFHAINSRSYMCARWFNLHERWKVSTCIAICAKNDRCQSHELGLLRIMFCCFTDRTSLKKDCLIIYYLNCDNILKYCTWKKTLYPFRLPFKMLSIYTYVSSLDKTHPTLLTVTAADALHIKSYFYDRLRF